jgi:enoyl-[acyl-carrier protein] reductase I
VIDLRGKKGLVVGIANDQSIAWAAARAMRDAGAELAATWQNERARPYVEPLLDKLGVTISQSLDVSSDEQMQFVFETIRARWGQLDFLLHAVAYAPPKDLHGRVVDCSKQGFLQAMDVSCHSFVRMARLSEQLMSKGGSLITMSYLGSQEAIPSYGLMGPVKAALESVVRYLAAELGSAGISVNAVSPGAIATRAASGLSDLSGMLQDSWNRSPMRRPLSIDDVGPLCAFLASEASRAITGETLYVDGGYHVLN